MVEIFKKEAQPREKKIYNVFLPHTFCVFHKHKMCGGKESEHRGYMHLSEVCARWQWWHLCSSPLLNPGRAPRGNARMPHQEKVWLGVQTNKRRVNTIHFKRKCVVTGFLAHVH